ncbi:MAG: hypothetical protein RI953_1783, partial [Pseudomonadota bacterium]
YVQPFMTIANVNGGSKVTFAPKLKTPRTNPLSVPSTVELRLASPNSTIQPFVGNLAVYHGVPSKTFVELFPYSSSGAASTAVTSQLIAGKCYTVGAKIMDSNNNEIDTLTGTALAKLGAKNFSVSSDYLNFDGGFYKKTASGGFSSFKFSSSDPMFAGSEFTVKDRKVVAIMGTDYPAGGITSFLQTSGGNLANSDELMFCQSDASSNPSTPPRPQLVVEMVAGLSYFNKQGDRVLLSPVSGSSAAFTVVPGPAAALQFFMKIVDASGNENLGPPICPLSPVYGGPYNFGAGIWLSPISGSGSVSPQLFEDNDIADCLAMSAEKGGFNIVAKVTDVAGNVLSQTPNGTWTFLAASGTTPFAAPSGSSNFTQTGNTYRDQQRRAGMYTVEYNESTTGLKARIVAKVKAGRAASFSMYAPPTILATQGFNVSVDFRDNWGNNICEGFRGFNGTGFGRDLEFGSANNSGQVSVRWTGAIPTTPKFPVGGVLGDGTEWNATFQCANNGQHVSSRLQIPTVGVYALEADSDSLRTTSGSIIPVASTRKSSSIKVLPGAVNVTKLEYITAPGGKGYLPSTSGTELSSSPSATEASAFPYVLRSFDLSYDVGTAIGVYIAGYDLEDNFSRAIPSTLTSISANELEILASTSPDYFAVGCNQPTRVLCQMNADSGGEERGIVHILAGIRAGTTQIKLTNNENSTDVKTLPSFQIVPGTPTHLIPTAMDSSKMINGSTPGSSIQSVLAGSEMSFKLRLTDSNRNTILSHNQESLLDFQFSGAGNGETLEKDVNTRPQSRRYSFVNGVTTDTVTTKVVVTGDYFLRISSPASTYGGIIDFGTQGILPGPFHHYGANTFGPGQYGSYVAHRDLLTKFTTVIDRRDEFGNVLEPSADMVPVSLKLKSFGSTTFTGQLHGTTENIQLSTNSPTTTISDLSYPEPGLFYMDVFDNNGKSVNYIFSSPTFDIDADLTTIAGYKIEHITKNPNPAITAGESTFFKVYPTARYGSVFSIEDSLLNSLRFQWSGADNALNPTQTPPVLPTQLTFSSGTAEVPVTFFRAQSISGNLKITDIDASVGQTGTFPGTITVNPGPIADYQLQTCINNLNCGTSLKTRKAEKSIDGYFDVKISTFDAWMNPRAGEAGLKLVARKISGPVNTVAGFYASSGSNADTTVDTSNMNLRPGTLNFYNLYYPVGHTVELDIENGSVPSSVKPQIEFQYSPNSIAKYKLETSTTNVQTGPNNLQLTVSVLDRVGNVIPNLDDVLNLRSYRIDGPGYSPDGTPPKLEDNSIATLSNNWTFTQGVALKTLSLYRAE